MPTNNGNMYSTEEPIVSSTITNDTISKNKYISTIKTGDKKTTIIRALDGTIIDIKIESIPIDVPTSNPIGGISINSGTAVDDDIDQVKALSAKGLINLVGKEGATYNKIQQAILNLNKLEIFNSIEVDGNSNNIILNLSPNNNIVNNNSVIRFKAVFNNTGPVTIDVNGEPIPVTLWNGSELKENNIMRGSDYAILPVSSSFVLLNPSLLFSSGSNEETSNSLTALYKIVNDHIDESKKIVTHETNGLMSSLDKVKLDEINLTELVNISTVNNFLITAEEANLDWNES